MYSSKSVNLTWESSSDLKQENEIIEVFLSDYVYCLWRLHNPEISDLGILQMDPDPLWIELLSPIR